LRARDEGYAYAFSDTGAIRAAVDQDLVEFDAGSTARARSRSSRR
jgi:molybdopterin synthase sulfur carrier subunit